MAIVVIISATTITITTGGDGFLGMYNPGAIGVRV